MIGTLTACGRCVGWHCGVRRWSGLVLALLLAGPVAWAQSGADISIAIRGQHRSVEGLAADNAVHIQLTISPGVGSRASSPDVYDRPPTQADESLPTFLQVQSEDMPESTSEIPLDPLERDEFVDSTQTGPSPRRSRGQSTIQDVDEARVPFLLSTAFMRRAIDVALSAQGIRATLERLDALGSRAKTSALLPELRFRAGRDSDQSLRLAPTDDDPYRYTQTGGVSYVIEGAATFRLSRLVFASDELGIERLRLAQARERQRVGEVVLQELLAWEQARRAVLAGSGSARAAHTALHQSQLRLDVLTNGWFSAHEPAELRAEGVRGPARANRGGSASGPTPGESQGRQERRWVEARARTVGLE